MNLRSGFIVSVLVSALAFAPAYCLAQMGGPGDHCGGPCTDHDPPEPVYDATVQIGAASLKVTKGAKKDLKAVRDMWDAYKADGLPGGEIECRSRVSTLINKRRAQAHAAKRENDVVMWDTLAGRFNTVGEL